MSKPITVEALQPLSFEERLLLVKAEVINRTQSQPDSEKNYQRTRLWVLWLKKNVLDLPMNRGVQA
ncbi:MAG: hypothetical protein RLZZ215_411 [Pseudomonadota bacterium]|jgi:hypothetical protein